MAEKQVEPSYEMDWEEMDYDIDAAPKGWKRQEFMEEIDWLFLRGEDYRAPIREEPDRDVREEDEKFERLMEDGYPG